MSSQAVVNAIQTVWATSLNAVLPYFETINVEPDLSTLPDLWGSLSYPDSSEARMSIGSTTALWREEGVVSIIVFYRAGSGKNVALTAADTARDLYRSFVGVNGRLFINNASPAREAPDRIAGDYYLLFVDLAYRYDFFR